MITIEGRNLQGDSTVEMFMGNIECTVLSRYELLRFTSDVFVWPEEMRRLHHFKLGTQALYRPLSWWSLGGGLELMHRSNETITPEGPRWGQFSGQTVEGIFLQPTLVSYFQVYRQLRVGLKVNLPRIQSISQRTVRAFSPELGEHERVLEERLLPYQLSLSLPLISK